MYTEGAMSPLEDIREDLYATQPSEPAARPGEAASRREEAAGVRTAWEEEPSAAPRLMDRFYLARLRTRRLSARTAVTLALFALLGIAAFIGYTVFLGRSDVELEIRGPDQLTAGEPTILAVRIVNRSSATLKDGAVTLNLPPGALISGRETVSLGPLRERLAVEEIPAGGEFLRELRIQFLGRSGDVERISGLFLYRPENVQTKLTRQAEFLAPIVRVPVVITVDAPGEAAAGEELTLAIGVDTETSAPLPQMSLGIDFPPGFELRAADPAPPAETPNLWPLGNLGAGISTKIVLRGVLQGDPQEPKPFHLRLGRYDPAAKSWLILTETTAGPVIASPFLLVETTVGGNRRGALVPGTRVEGSVRFRNNLPQKVENLTVTVSFPEQFVELETVQAEDGFYDVTRRALTWNPASARELRELAPGAEGAFTFSFNLKHNPPVRSFADKNFSFPITTAIDSGTPPPEFRGVALAYRDRITFQIVSRLTIAARATYYDSPAGNSGPLPPRVREPTTYSVFLQLGSGANDVEDVSVKAALPGGVEFGRVIGSDAGTVEFNAASRELVWRVGRLAAATGTLRPHAAAIIELALTPAENQVGSSPPLLLGIIASGQDSFTASELSATAEDVTIELRTDSRSNFREWRVVP